MRFKNLEGKPERKSPKWTISASGGLGLLQMVSEPDIRRCISEEAKPQKGIDTRQCASKDAGPRRGWIGESNIDWRRERVPTRTLGPEGVWIVRTHIRWGGERIILYKGVETSP